jgi:hypothetical protein
MSKRYEKQVPGHHVQVDVKSLQFTGPEGRRVKRYQFTAIDDATRIRALKICDKHTQASAIDFIDHVVERFPFRIHTVRTDNGHEFQALFHWHVEDLGMRHVYIRPRSPNPTGRWSVRTSPTSSSSTSRRSIPATSICAGSSPSGRSSTTPTGRTRPSEHEDPSLPAVA